jgi:molybdenum cofactor guanylyltransferase
MSGLGVSRAGFVLVGGESSRMGRDKALLEFEGSTVAARIAECVRSVAGSVTLIGPPERYRHLGYNIIPDRVSGFGPIGGVHTALESTHSEWNLIVACDMPFITARLLEDLFTDAESGPSTADVIVPETPFGDGTRLDPLCAVYQRRCASAARRAIGPNADKKMLRKHPVTDAAPLANLNTPAEWSGV